MKFNAKILGFSGLGLAVLAGVIVLILWAAGVFNKTGSGGGGWNPFVTKALNVTQIYTSGTPPMGVQLWYTIEKDVDVKNVKVGGKYTWTTPSGSKPATEEIVPAPPQFENNEYRLFLPFIVSGVSRTGNTGTGTVQLQLIIDDKVQETVTQPFSW